MSSYDFRSLSPLDFEELVRDLLQAELDIRFESFAQGRDSGIDLRYSAGPDSIVVQAKHYVGSRFSSLLAAARRENIKLRALKPVRYIFATSLSLSPANKARLKSAFESVQLAEADILGREWLNAALSRHPGVERTHFKLWLTSVAMLDRFVNAGIYNRTALEIEEIRRVVPRFVQNESVPQAMQILGKGGSLVISGEPGVGKSTLARLILWLHMSDGWEVVAIDDISDAFKAMNDQEKRIILFDDFLGQVRLTTDALRAVDQRLPSVVARTKSNKNLRFVMTSRDYILRQAQVQSERLSLPGFALSELCLNVGLYTRSVRARIFFNHIYFSDLSATEKQLLIGENFYMNVIGHRNFNPRLISSITSPEYFALMDRPSRTAVISVLDKPDMLWQRPFRSHISDDSRTLVIALFFGPTNGVALERLEQSFDKASVTLARPVPAGDLVHRFRTALREVEGSFVGIQSRIVAFANPGLRDFVGRVIVEDKLLPIIVARTTDSTELNQAWSIGRVLAKESAGESGREVSEAIWCDALVRAATNPESSIVKLLEIALECYSQWSTDLCEQTILFVVERFRTTDLDESEARLTMLELENLALTSLPQRTIDDVQSEITKAVLKTLSASLDYISIDDIRWFSEGLVEYGGPKPEVAEAVAQVLNELPARMPVMLREVSGHSELDDYEHVLVPLLINFGIETRVIKARIASRREDLDVRETSGGSMNRIGSNFPADISDAEIHSMFASLLQQ